MKKDKPKYIQEKKLKNGVIAYYFVIPARCIPEGLEIEKSVSLGINKWEAYAKADDLNKYIKSFRKEGRTKLNRHGQTHKI